MFFCMPKLKGFSWPVRNLLKWIVYILFKLKKIVAFAFALSVITSPSLAWGWGQAVCSGSSNEKAIIETKTEQLDQADA